MQRANLKVGVISDTHALVRPEALEALSGVSHIIHAGDIGSPLVLESLQNIAPVTAVRGNLDYSDWSSDLPATAVLRLQDSLVYIIHNLNELDLDPRAAGFQVVISGHTHRPKTEWIDDVLYFNPGAAGPRRFRLPISLGILRIRESQIIPDIIYLTVD